MLRVFIGFDRQEPVSYHVAAHSLMRHARAPVASVPLMLSQLPILTRPRDPKQSTDFAFARFLVPWLCGYQGVAVFVDCDVLFRVDIRELIDAADLTKPVSVVKHEYTPRDGTKFLEHEQHAYRRKNWSSVMVFNCGMQECWTLTPDYVNTATGLELHQFAWIPDAERIGALPAGFNHLVGEHKRNADAKIVHFTLGTPCFARYRDCEFAREWFEELDRARYYDRTGEFSRPVREEPLALEARI